MRQQMTLQKTRMQSSRFRVSDTEEGFKNQYKLTKKFADMTANEKMLELYANVLILPCIYVIIGYDFDVAMASMSDEKFLDFFNKARVETGMIDQKMLPDGVACNGTININGLVLTMFTYAEKYVDLDGKEKTLLPAGTLAMLTPGMGATAYAQVTFVKKGDGFKSYAEPIVIRVLDELKQQYGRCSGVLPSDSISKRLGWMACGTGAGG